MARALSVIADQAFSRAAGAPLIDGNAVRVLRDARENYPAWMSAIQSARKWIHFESYIIHDDQSGCDFARALMERARAGVHVRVVYDWLGAVSATTWMFWERMRRAGIEVRAVWAATGKPLPEDELLPDGAVPNTGNTALRVIASKPATAGMFRLDQLVAAVARKTLWITDAYFVGASPYVQALVAAADDDVDVRLLVPGGSDLPLLQPLTRAGYRQLLEAGVRIFEWNGSMVEDLERATEIVLSARSVRRVTGASSHSARPRHRPRWSHRTGRTRRAATAGALRLGRTFRAALTARRQLGAAEVWSLIYGMLLLGAIGFVGLKWPRGLAYPLGIFSIWIAISLLIQAAKLWGKRAAAVPETKPAGRREDAA